MTDSHRNDLASVLDTASAEQTLPEGLAGRLSVVLSSETGLEIYPASLAVAKSVLYALGRKGIHKYLVAASSEEARLGEFSKQALSRARLRLDGVHLHVVTCQANQEAATIIRQELPFTRPSLMGLQAALGCGDRLGIATPGHIRAIRGTGLAGFFAQQSIREMTRTARSPEQVLDAATWGVFEEGYREGFGADADHLKDTQDIDRCLAVGFTMFTIDPGDHVDDAADGANDSTLASAFEGLPWDELETTQEDCRCRYLERAFVLTDMKLEFTEEMLVRAAVKYGKAVAHTVKLYRHLLQKAGEGQFELEMSVDETATPTSTAEHFFVANELKRLGVKWVSLAPRFVGEFEKGVDYQGDLSKFEASFKQHVEVTKALGPYKLSIHSGSDKFSIYPIAAELAGGLVHLKTAGTSYLEALRVIAEIEPGLFRQILGFAFTRYDEDRASYHVSADPGKVRQSADIPDKELPGLLDEFDAREMLHVTFGSVLTWKEGNTYRFRDRLLLALRQNEEIYYQVLQRHLGRHVTPFKKR